MISGKVLEDQESLAKTVGTVGPSSDDSQQQPGQAGALPSRTNNLLAIPPRVLAVQTSINKGPESCNPVDSVSTNA